MQGVSPIGPQLPSRKSQTPPTRVLLHCYMDGNPLLYTSLLHRDKDYLCILRPYLTIKQQHFSECQHKLPQHQVFEPWTHHDRCTLFHGYRNEAFPICFTHILFLQGTYRLSHFQCSNYWTALCWPYQFEGNILKTGHVTEPTSVQGKSPNGRHSWLQSLSFLLIGTDRWIFPG